MVERLASTRGKLERGENIFEHITGDILTRVRPKAKNKPEVVEDTTKLEKRWKDGIEGGRGRQSNQITVKPGNYPDNLITQLGYDSVEWTPRVEQEKRLICEWIQTNPREWFCKTHKILLNVVAGSKNPVDCMVGKPLTCSFCSSPVSHVQASHGIGRLRFEYADVIVSENPQVVESRVKKVTSRRVVACPSCADQIKPLTRTDKVTGEKVITNCNVRTWSEG